MSHADESTARLPLMGETARARQSSNTTAAASRRRRRGVLRRPRGRMDRRRAGSLRRPHVGRARERRPGHDRPRGIGHEGPRRADTGTRCYPDREHFPSVGEMGARRPFFARRNGMAQVHEKERQLQREVAETVGDRLPDVEVLAVELARARAPHASTSTTPTGVDHALCEQVTDVLRELPRALHARRLLAGARAPAPHARALRRRRRPAGGDPHGRRGRGAQALPRRGRRRRRARGHARDAATSAWRSRTRRSRGAI